MENKGLGTEWADYLQLQKDRPELFADNGSLHIMLDASVVADYVKRTGRKIGVLYKSAYTMMLVDLVYEEEGSYYAYERLVPAVAKGAVVMITKYEGKMILLKQYRHAIRDYQYAFPRGFAEEGISAEDNCEKELQEEIGAMVKKVSFLGMIAPDSGMQQVQVSAFLCEIEKYDACMHTEGIHKIITVSRDELDKMIASGEITDGFTLAALSLYDAKSDENKGE